jgi:ribose-phosphate pyrophosphokinase
MVRIFINNEEYSYNTSIVPGGEVNVQIINAEELVGDINVVLIGYIESAHDLVELGLINNAIENLKYCNINDKRLMLGYLPYARQDRVCNPGEPLSIKFMTDYINNMNFDKVLTLDNHSDVSNALINNLLNVPLPELIATLGVEIDHNIITKLEKYDFIISPDAGANKKCLEVSKQLQVPMIRADKVRDTKTGKITNTEVYCTENQLKDKNVIIFDDICDGGRTFIELAKVLKEKQAKSVTLFVTHGIFSKGVDVLFENGIDLIMTTDTRTITQTDEIKNNSSVIVLELLKELI